MSPSIHVTFVLTFVPSQCPKWPLWPPLFPQAGDVLLEAQTLLKHLLLVPVVGLEAGSTRAFPGRCG